MERYTPFVGDILQIWKPRASQVELMVKNPSANARHKWWGFDPWVGKIPWRTAWQHMSVFFPGESHGERSLTGYSPWGCRVGHYWSDVACTHAYCAHGLEDSHFKVLPFMSYNWISVKVNFIFGCPGSPLLHGLFSSCSKQRAPLQLLCTGFSLQRPLLLWSTSWRCTGFSSCGTWAQSLGLLGSRAHAQ